MMWLGYGSRNGEPLPTWSRDGEWSSLISKDVSGSALMVTTTARIVCIQVFFICGVVIRRCNKAFSRWLQRRHSRDSLAITTHSEARSEARSEF